MDGRGRSDRADDDQRGRRGASKRGATREKEPPEDHTDNKQCDREMNDDGMIRPDIWHEKRSMINDQ